MPCILNPSLHIAIVLTCLTSVRKADVCWLSRHLATTNHWSYSQLFAQRFTCIFYFLFQLIFNFRFEHLLALPNERSGLQEIQVSWDLTPTDCKYVQIITSSNQRLWECVRRRINVYTDTLNDFPSWLSTSENQPFFINNQVFTERYFIDQAHAIPIEEVPVQTHKFNRTYIFTSAFKFRAKYSHNNL